MDQIKTYRSFPPPNPLKISKLLQYQYFSQIYQKYDCNFFREILPYFSEIITTDKLQLLKYVYVPIENPNKLSEIKIGLPFHPFQEQQNIQFYELKNQATFIKIAYQVHVIFQYLINLNLVSLGIGRMKFQDKFWMFTQGVVRTYCFGEIIYKKEEQRQKSIIFILQGEFKCMNKQNKSFQTIRKGDAIDVNGKIKKLRFQQKLKRSVKRNQTPVLESKEIAVILTEMIESQGQTISSLWSYSNNAKLLVVDLNTVRKYTLFEPLAISCFQIPKIPNQKPLPKIQIRKKLQSLINHRRIKTQNQENQNQPTTQTNNTTLKKPTLFSSRIPNNSKDPTMQYPVQQIYDNQIVKTYTKEKEIFSRIKKVQQIKKKRANWSQNPKPTQSPTQKTMTKSNLLPFFKQQIKEEKQKVILKRRKTKQLWGNGSIHYGEKQNFVTKNQQFFQSLRNSTIRTFNSQESKISTPKLTKSELSTFYLLKRNLYNKEYHKNNLFPQTIK